MLQDTTLTEIFEQFLLEKKYVYNCSEKHERFLKLCFRSWELAVGVDHIPTKADLMQFVIGMKERGVKTGGCNSYIKGFNSLLSWLHQNDYIKEPLRIPLLKAKKLILREFSEIELTKIANFKPETFSEQRLHTLLCLLMDTGIRINEALTLTLSRIDWDDLTMIVDGKGDKQRIVPFSLELKELLAQYVSVLRSCRPKLPNKHLYVFSSASNKPVSYFNIRRNFFVLCKKTNIDPEGFHTFRRTFARNYLRRGGNLLYLQKAMGHERLDTTQRYIEVEIDDLKRTQLATSILSRVKR